MSRMFVIEVDDAGQVVSLTRVNPAHEAATRVVATGNRVHVDEGVDLFDRMTGMVRLTFEESIRQGYADKPYET